MDNIHGLDGSSATLRGTGSLLVTCGSAPGNAELKQSSSSARTKEPE